MSNIAGKLNTFDIVLKIAGNIAGKNARNIVRCDVYLPARSPAILSDVMFFPKFT